MVIGVSLESKGKQIEDQIVLRVPRGQLSYFLLVLVLVVNQTIVLDILHSLQNNESRHSNEKDKANLRPCQRRIIELPHCKVVK